jgi:KDO2-lipid IV(A) lauroyltransferase
MQARKAKRSSNPYHPGYWGVWLFLGCLRLVVLLPYGAQLACGRALGALMWHLAGPRRRITKLNLKICFPELSTKERARLARAHFESLGIAFVETAVCWWGEAARLEPLITIRGLEHLERALDAGRGALLLSAHFTTLEIGGRLLGLRARFHPMYKRSRNPVIERFQRGRREHHFGKTIAMDDVRNLLKSLKQNVPVWYAPDQGFTGKGYMLVPFFGVPAPTNPATSRIAKLSNAPVLFFATRRLPGTAGYELTIHPPLEGFPTDDVEADALRINALIETEVRRCPEQYLWVHNRFKTAAHRTPPAQYDPAVKYGALEPEKDADKLP